MVPYPLGWMQDRRRRSLAPPRHEPPGSLGVRRPAKGQKGEASLHSSLQGGERLE